MVFLLGWLTVLFAGVAITLHKIAYQPVWPEIICWVLAFIFFIYFQKVLHQ